MGIERQVIPVQPKRQPGELLEKHKRIQEYLQMELVPVHTLAWKELRLDVDGGDCLPVIDVLERMAEMIATMTRLTERPSTEEFICECGQACKSKAGLVKHQKKCGNE